VLLDEFHFRALSGKLEGGIPEEIGQLSQLRELYVFDAVTILTYFPQWIVVSAIGRNSTRIGTIDST
jgi:hypothetical protein